MALVPRGICCPGRIIPAEATMTTTTDTTHTDPAQALRGLMPGWDQKAWCLAAVVLSADERAPGELRAAAATVLRAAGVHAGLESGLSRRDSGAQIEAAQARTSLMQIAGALTGQPAGWASQPDEVLRAQGQASAQGAQIARSMLHLLDGMTERLDAPGATMLDVGVGVAAQAVAFAELFPSLTVVGIDSLPRALELAKQTVAASPAADRVVLREQDIAALDEQACYDLAFVPAPFVPYSALQAGLPRVVRAMKPGAWLCLAHGRFGGTPLEDSVTRLTTLIFGGASLDGDAARKLLTESGLTQVSTIPAPAPGPGITLGRLAPTSMP
jgi:predicted O-methyltransferase YrrM